MNRNWKEADPKTDALKKAGSSLAKWAKKVSKEEKYKGVSNLSLKDENKLIHEMFRSQDAKALKRDVITDYPFKKNQGNKKKEKRKRLMKLKIPSKDPSKLHREGYFRIKKMTPLGDDVRKALEKDLDRHFETRRFA